MRISVYHRTCKANGVAQESHGDDADVPELPDDGCHDDQQRDGSGGAHGHGEAHQGAGGAQIAQEPEEEGFQESEESTCRFFFSFTIFFLYSFIHLTPFLILSIS